MKPEILVLRREAADQIGFYNLVKRCETLTVARKIALRRAREEKIHGSWADTYYVATLKRVKLKKEKT